MGFPAVLIIAAKKILQKKALNQVASLILKEKPDKVGILTSYLGGLGKSINWVRKYRKVAQQAAESIAKNKKQIADLTIGIKKGNKKLGGNARWSVKKAETNIKIAMGAKSSFVKKSIQKFAIKKIKSMIPARRLAMSVKDFYKAVHNKEGWIKIGKKLGNLIANAKGGRDLQHLFGIVDKYSSIDLTVNHFWKRISENHNPDRPIIGASGGASLRYIMQFKQKYMWEFFDREFWFNVNSPITGNFSKDLHSYDPTIRMYSVPIRGWGGTRLQRYFFYGEDTPTLSSVVNLCCNGRIDFGTAIYWKYMHTQFTREEKEKFWARKDPYWNRIHIFITKKNKRNI